MSTSRPHQAARFAIAGVLAIAWSADAAALSAAQSPPRTMSAAQEAAHRALREFLDAGAGPLRTWTHESVPRLCELWLAYARAAGLPEAPEDYLEFRQSLPPGLQGWEDYWVSMAITGIRSVNYRCPPEGTSAKKAGIQGRTIVVGGGIVAAGAGILLAAGGGGADPAPAPPAPANVTSFHGLYTGRLITGSSSIPGCGRAATVPCNAQVGGNTTGTPASLSFGGDLPSTGVLHATGVMQNFRYEGPANGLAATPGGILIVWQQQGAIASNVLTLDGTATVTSPGACNGAVITTRVEATKN
jgi:hypothetical protein